MNVDPSWISIIRYSRDLIIPNCDKNRELVIKKNKKDQIRLSVRELVEYVYGGGDLRASVSVFNRALEGTRAHQVIQAQRGDDYRKEVSVSHFIDEPALNLKVMIHGRIDGVFVEDGKTVIEEIKSTLKNLDSLTFEEDSLHFAQAKTYAYIFSQRENLDEVVVRLTYVSLESGKTCLFSKDCDQESLTQFFDDTVEAYLERLRELNHWQEIRNLSIESLSFPFKTFRRGQQEFSEEVHQAITEEYKLFAQAPTGLGKTLAVLQPAIKTLGEDFCSKLFYLTARTTAREAAEKALDQFREKGLRLKSITLTAKEKICPKAEMDCSPEACDYLIGYYDRVKEGLRDIFTNDAFTRELIESIATKYRLCPFEFSLDLSVISDCIICDYNYLYDPKVQLHRYFSGGPQPFVFLVDEAHNLVERSRGMYSAALEKKEFLKIKKLIDKKEYPELHKTITTLDKYLLGVRKSSQQDQTPFKVDKECPTEFIEYLEDFIIPAEIVLSYKGSLSFREPLQEFYYYIGFFIKIAKLAKDLDAFVTTTVQKGSDLTIKILCLDASAQLRETTAKGLATIYFSATLTPMNYFYQLLGGNENDKDMQLPSPFPEQNLCLNLINRISTRYRDREMSYEPIADYLTAFVNQKKGNYLICFPSYAYMERVFEQFFPLNLEIDLVKQQRSMTEPDRDRFLDRFTVHRPKTLVGFIVMGGIFAESVDLPGERLTGAAIIGVGLPQINKERDLILQYFDYLSGSGFQFAYTFPGMSRVLQAAGRVIRTETDRGSLLLIDDRFAHAGYQRLFPLEWAGMNLIRNQQHLTEILADFWAE